MFNRRKISRYHLLRPLKGFIEHGEIRHPGEVIELSTAGFRFCLRNTTKDAFIAAKSTHDFGEVIYGHDEVGGFGDIRYVRAEGSDILIGFKWDDIHANAHIDKTFSIIGELISEKSAGCVNVSNGVVELAGHVFSALADDIRQSLSKDFPRISLRECTSIDLSGLAMLTELANAKVRLEDASSEVHALLQSYRVKGDALMLSGA